MKKEKTEESKGHWVFERSSGYMGYRCLTAPLGYTPTPTKYVIVTNNLVISIIIPIFVETIKNHYGSSPHKIEFSLLSDSLVDILTNTIIQ